MHSCLGVLPMQGREPSCRSTNTTFPKASNEWNKFESTRNAVPNLHSQIHFPSIQDLNSFNLNTRMVQIDYFPWKQNTGFHPSIPQFQQSHGLKLSRKQYKRCFRYRRVLIIWSYLVYYILLLWGYICNVVYS